MIRSLYIIIFLLISNNIFAQKSTEKQTIKSIYFEQTALPVLSQIGFEIYNNSKKRNLLFTSAAGIDILEGPIFTIGSGYVNLRPEKKSSIITKLTYSKSLTDDGNYWILESGFNYTGEKGLFIRICPGIFLIVYDNEIAFYPLPALSVKVGYSNYRRGK